MAQTTDLLLKGWVIGNSVVALILFGFALLVFLAFFGAGGSPTQATAAAVDCSGLKAQPPEFSDYLCSAGEKFKLDPAFQLAILFVEHRGTYQEKGGRIVAPKDPISVKWPCSGAGACGPAQFIASTWEGYKQDGMKFRPGDGGEDGRKDIDKWSDAIFGSSNYLAASGGKPVMDERLVQTVAGKYNGGPSCPCPGDPENGPYMEMVLEYWKKFRSAS